MASTIKVDNIQNQCGGAVVTKCGATTTISGSVIKADDIQAADGGNIINQCGTTITLGASGDTINLASGASQTGFGRTGTVDWDTTAKTASFTAVSGEGYFVNTTSGALTMTLPASPSAGDIVAVSDYASTFDTNNLTVGRNSQPINGSSSANFISATKGVSLTFVYVDGTRGWKAINSSTIDATGAPDFVTATGGTVTTCGDCKIHTFTGPGTFTVTKVASCAPQNIMSHLVIAGGGSGGSRDRAGGGGAGGYREVKNPITPYTASPLDGYPSAPNRVTITAQSYPITVGAGASANLPDSRGNQGGTSSFSTISSAGGGAGGNSTTDLPLAGGSGGGMGVGGVGNPGTPGGSGNTPPVSPPQGQNGGAAQHIANGGSGGGGGAGAVGGNGDGNVPGTGGAGGNGVATSITGSSVTRAGGGGGGGDSGNRPGGTGGGGAGQAAGTANTGGGGGGTHNPGGQGGAGGSGIVVIRYKFQ
jgi:hypothetical protein